MQPADFKKMYADFIEDWKDHGTFGKMTYEQFLENRLVFAYEQLAARMAIIDRLYTQINQLRTDDATPTRRP